ncbi:hypothetical protein [Croceicoccus mobilis]|uniref:AAA+ ATPase domain-containing protein n=2 Tax=Croceicoccus mobilis TaxID=1703339 RepID=A0A916Z466_9SPHN|nr:hypothetical protein [Croceicoccus mobilis]GGD75977.1 hypothetical protein GCM10010990_27010 [Croceicoccus mobilis]
MKPLRFLLAPALAAAATIFSVMPISPAMAQGQGAAPSAPAGEADTPARRAARIRALADGDLSPAIAAPDLFRYSLGGPDVLRLRAVKRMVAEKSVFDAAAADPTALTTLSPEQAALAVAEASFLRLPEARREQLLEQHAQKHAAFQREQDEGRSDTREIEALTQQLGELRAFLDGRPTNPLVLNVNPLADGRSVLAGEAPDDVPQPGENASADDRIAWLKDQIVLAKRRILQLPPERLAMLAAASGINSGAGDAIALAEAQLDRARMQLSDAQLAAINAASEHERLIAGEHARLLKVKQAQAQFRSDLARSVNRPDAIMEEAYSWRRRSQDAASGVETGADTLYGELVAELTQVRRDLRAALNAPDIPASAQLDPPSLDPALLPDAPETRALRGEVAGLVADAAKLRAAYLEQLWERREALRNSMNLLNDARLTLLTSLSVGKRARVTGFGAEGVAQVRREISEIVLELRFNLQSWRRTLMDLADRVATPSPGFVLAMLRIFVLLLFFAWWRRRGDVILTRAEVEAARKRPRTMALSLQTAALRHWRGIRGPLDWLILTALLWWLWPDELVVSGLRFVWIVLFWSLATVVLVRLVNELASGRRREDPRAALRWRSLKLLAGSLLVIGLMLNLTRAVVGRGAIYNWVVTAAWLLVPVVAVLLAHWWRERIVRLADAQASDSALLRWVARDPGGITGNLGRIAVGLLLLLKGMRLIIARRIRDVALVREMLDQRSRLAAEKQVAQDKASGRFHRLPPETLAVFEPHRLPAKLRTGRERPGQNPLPQVKAGSLTLVIGERGLGKSSFLHDLAENCGEECRIISLEIPQCPGPDALDALLADAGVGAGFISGEGEHLFIMVDDIQRLIVPAIGGLSELDRLITLARASGPRCRWVFTISEASWRFLQRARSDRILFDTMIELPHWSAAELRSLIERRTAQAGIDPDFSDMIDDGVFEFGEDVSPIERRKRGYFERLTDYVSGNPAIALDTWRRSLFVDGRDQRVTVRTFDTPPVDTLAALPMPALFVLRVILQMDFADVRAIRASTDLPDMMVSDALRRLERMGVAVETDGGYQIALHWWIEVVRLLARQNLIVREKR